MKTITSGGRDCICAARPGEEHLAGCPERYCTCFARENPHLKHLRACPASRAEQDGLDLAALRANLDFMARVAKADDMLALNAKQRIVVRELRVSLILTENKKRRDAERPVEPHTKPHGE